MPSHTGDVNARGGVGSGPTPTDDDQQIGTPAGQPLLQVVKGSPTPAEFAAVVAVISAKLRTAEPPAHQSPGTRSGTPSGTRSGPPPWAAYWREQARQPLRPGPGAWRASALPR